MDLGNVIYLVAVIVYFIYSALKKNKQELPEENDRPAPDGPVQRPVNFEDLLKEIRRGQQEAQKDFEQSGQGSNWENKSKEPIQAKKERVSSTFKEVKQPSAYQAFQGAMDDDYKPKYKTLDEQIRISSSIEGLKTTGVAASKNQKKELNRYTRLFKNPQSVKDAVVFSEVLKRKF
jgi:hypothetical protein